MRMAWFSNIENAISVERGREPRDCRGDRALDGWTGERLGAAEHACGTVLMGLPGAVDVHGRVRGVAGLRVAGASILPDAPLRGAAAPAVLVGEIAAGSFRCGA